MKTCTKDDCARTVHARGLCMAHYERWLRSVPPSQDPSAELSTCSGCSRLVRPSKRTPAQYPGLVTIAFGGYGKCKSCYKRARRGVVETVTDPSSAAREARAHAYNLQGLASFIARRNARLVAMERTYRLAA